MATSREKQIEKQTEVERESTEKFVVKVEKSK
jgi:hypothetical protein